MTTIAAKFSTLEIAADTIISGDDSFYRVSKLRFGPNSIYGACGDWNKCLKALSLVEKKSPKPSDWEADLEVTILQLRKDGLWIYESSIIPTKLKNDYWAVGTGANFAITAMRLGKSPAEAVAIASEFDPYTRTPIESYKLEIKNDNKNKRQRVHPDLAKSR